MDKRWYYARDDDDDDNDNNDDDNDDDDEDDNSISDDLIDIHLMSHTFTNECSLYDGKLALCF